MKTIDPGRMAPAERLAELAELLAAGFQRLQAHDIKSIPGSEKSQDDLDVLAASEAPCPAMQPEAP